MAIPESFVGGQPPPDGAVRLICDVADRGVRVVSRRRLAKVAPPTESFADADPAAPRSGFWIEVRDAQGRTRYRRAVPDPLTDRHEAPGPNGSFVQIRGRGSDRFALLVPEIEDGEDVVLMRGTSIAGAAAAGGPRRATGEIARLSLRDQRQAPR